MVSYAIGLLGALVAALFFGSNYVPTKAVPQGDGFTNVFIFSVGVLSVGVATMLSVAGNDNTTFVFSGLLGGSLWATGNLCVIPIIKCIGLGLGMLLWGSTSLVTGFLVGKFGAFGLPVTPVNEAMNWTGFALILASMAVFFFIKPNLDEQPMDEYSQLTGPKSAKSIQEEAAVEKSVFDTIPAHLKFAVGVPLAIGSGILYGFNVIPMNVWSHNYTTSHNGESPNPLAFIFSHLVGIWIFSTVVFLLYALVQKVKFGKSPQVYAQSIVPAYISGVMWAIAQCGILIASVACGLAVGFPVGSAGPMIVSSIWSVFYFREITGRRNITFLLISFAFLGGGITLLVLSGLIAH